MAYLDIDDSARIVCLGSSLESRVRANVHLGSSFWRRDPWLQRVEILFLFWLSDGLSSPFFCSIFLALSRRGPVL
jgi:hypothetical protein